MSDPTKTDETITGEDNTIRPDTPTESHGATEDQVVHVSGPASGDKHEGGTQDSGINPQDELSPG
ncbi:MAG: hypothetical protein KAX40_01440 [Herpetosiphon sp.]|nr:hypothetical protein [Herpetosiphon sp.]